GRGRRPRVDFVYAAHCGHYLAPDGFRQVWRHVFFGVRLETLRRWRGHGNLGKAAPEGEPEAEDPLRVEGVVGADQTPLLASEILDRTFRDVFVLWPDDRGASAYGPSQADLGN